jgi:hypothetical protein
MRVVGRWLLVGWLLAALTVLGINGRLSVFLAWMAPASALALGIGALVCQQRAPSILDRPTVPERYRVADDLRQPITTVVTVAEHEAIVGWEKLDGHREW